MVEIIHAKGRAEGRAEGVIKDSAESEYEGVMHLMLDMAAEIDAQKLHIEKLRALIREFRTTDQ